MPPCPQPEMTQVAPGDAGRRTGTEFEVPGPGSMGTSPVAWRRSGSLLPQTCHPLPPLQAPAQAISLTTWKNPILPVRFSSSPSLLKPSLLQGPPSWSSQQIPYLPAAEGLFMCLPPRLLSSLPEDKMSVLLISGSRRSRAGPDTSWAQPDEETEGGVTPHQTLTGPGSPEETPHSPHLFSA